MAALSTLSSLNGLYQEIYDRALVVARERSLFPSLVTPKSAKGWMVRKVGTWSTTTAVEVDEDEDVANAKEFKKTLTATINPTEIAAQFKLTDRMMETDPDGARKAAGWELGTAIAQKIDRLLAADMANFSKGKGASGATLTLAICAAALAYLQANEIPGPFVFVLHPYGWYDIWTELKGATTTGTGGPGSLANEALRQYYRSNLLGATWYISSNIIPDDTPDAISGVFNKQALVLDTRRPPRLEDDRDPSARATELTMTAGFGHGVYRSNYGVYITHDATEP